MIGKKILATILSLCIVGGNIVSSPVLVSANIVKESLITNNADQTDYQNSAISESEAEESILEPDPTEENSWRYSNGQPISQPDIHSRSGYSHAWEKVDGKFRNSKGEEIPGAVKKGIDVSEHNGKIDWEKVKNDGIDFAIIRCGYGQDIESQDDDYWEYNVSECERLGIPYGVYLYSYADTLAKAASEAQHVLRLLKGHSPSYPVYYDLEDALTYKLSNNMKTQVAKTFCNEISANGYKAGIYSSLDWWTHYLTDPVFDSWSRWVAQWNDTCTYEGEYDVWQCSSQGRVEGISTDVDLNFWMDDENSEDSNIPKTVAAPTLEPIKASKGVLTLTWNKVENATAYNIYHYNRQTLKYERITWTKDTTIQLLDQPKGEIDTYRVKAYFKGSGKTVSSVYSNAQSAKLFDSTTLSEVQQSGENLKFTWSKVKGTNGYSIYRKVVGEAEWQYLGATAGTSYTDENCQTGVRYAYRILPYGKVNGTAYFGPYSAPAYGTVLAKEIDAPTLEPITASKGILTLTWNKVENATAYNIYHYNRQTLKYELIAWTKDTTIQLSDQPKGEIDTYRVKAYCKGNGKTISSKYSNSQSAKLFDSTTLSNVEQSENGLTFTWSGVAGANGYTVYRRVVGEAEWTKLDATAELSYVDTTCTPGVRYAYRILPYGKVNGTAYFGPYSKSMEGMVFEKTEITEIVSNEGKVELSWNEIPGVIGYNVYRYNGENDTWETQKSVLDGTIYVDEAVEAGNTYSYYIKPYYRTSLNKVKYGYQSGVREIYVE